MRYKTMKLIQEFIEPQRGYWDGGMKKTFEWSLHDPIKEGEKFCRVGSWGANCFFPVRQGKTERATLGNARRSLAMRAKHAGKICKFSYVLNAF